MAGEKNIVLKGAGENGSDITTRSIGGKISFYTDHRNFQVISPKSDADELYGNNVQLYVKNGSNYEKIPKSNETATETQFTFENVKNNVGLNFYIEENTSQLTCPACDGDKTVTIKNKSYFCPCCNGTGDVIQATNVEIIGISAFFTKNSSVAPIIKYQVIPPGSITSTLIDAIDII